MWKKKAETITTRKKTKYIFHNIQVSSEHDFFKYLSATDDV